VRAILDAAVEVFRGDPSASMTAIAAAAGVDRITVYGHFKNRTELVEAVLEEAMHRADAVLDEVELSGDPAEALAALLDTSWRVVEQFGTVLHAAQRELPAECIRSAHDRVIRRLTGLIDRGRNEGAFRADLPTDWLVTVVLSVIHGASGEVETGRLDPDDVGRYLVMTLTSVVRAPA